jgi:hypothetical protein
MQLLAFAQQESQRRIHTIIVIITDHHLFNLSKLAHFTPEILVKRIKVILQLTWIHLVLWIVCWILVEIWEENGLRVRGFNMFSRTAIAVATGSDFVVERAVEFVCFCSEDGGEVIRHVESW